MKLSLLVLALVQALTEFLPVSSSGHLLLFENIFNTTVPRYAIILYLHMATFLAILVYFLPDLKRLMRDLKYLLKIGLAFTATVLIVSIIKGYMGKVFEDLRLVSFFFFLNSLLLFSSDLRKGRQGEISWSMAVLIGSVQAFAIFPGLSRSGITVSSAILMGAKREEAFSFSFLLAIPTMFAVGVYENNDMWDLVKNGGFTIYYTLAFIIAFIVGLLCLRTFKNFILKKRLSIFALYCCIIGIASYLLGGLR